MQLSTNNQIALIGKLYSPNFTSQVIDQPGKIPDEIVLFTTEELKAMDPGMRTGVIDYSADDSSGPQLALYGRADHSPQQTLTLLDKQRMILR